MEPYESNDLILNRILEHFFYGMDDIIDGILKLMIHYIL